MKTFGFLLIFSAAWSVNQATLGWDGIQAVSVDGFRCLSENGYSFFIGRIWQSVGNVDGTGIQNIKNAREAGWKFVDGYMFPCLKERCGTPKEQVEAMMNQLSADGAEVGMIWMDIEVQEWPADKAHNQAFVLELVQKAEEMGAKVGVYTSKNNWDQIIGLDWTGLKDKPLWYAHWNDKAVSVDPFETRGNYWFQSFDGFEPFGGWTAPAIHQFQGGHDGPCGVNMDSNWYP